MMKGDEHCRAGAAVAPGVLGGILLSNLAALTFEIVLTRIFSVTLWYHMAFMVVTAAMFGVGAGGLIVYYLAEKLSKIDTRELLADLESVKALLTAFFVVVYLSIPYVPGRILQPSGKSIPVVVAIFTLAALPFLMVGMVNGLSFVRYSRNVGRIYFADLSGAAAGVLVAIGGLYLVKAPSLVLIAAAASCGAALLFTPKRRAGSTTRAAVVSAALLLLMLYNLATDTVRVRYTKKYVEREVYYEKWSPIARITVIRYPLLTWGLGSRFDGRVPGPNYLIEQDGAAGTPIIPAGEGEDLEWLDWDVTSAAYWFMKPGSAVIIGSGGGKDIYSARRAGVEKIVAVEINPDIVRVVQEEFAGISGRPYSLPGVEMHVAEGRSFLIHTDDTYDLIQLSMVDSWAATTAGAFMMSENHLYTLEAFETYMQRLAVGGAVSLSRYFMGFFPSEIIRAFSLSAEALRREGAADPGAHIILLKSGNIGTIVVKKTPLSAEEENAALEEAKKRGYRIIFSPSYRGDEHSFFNVLSSRARPDDLYGKIPIDIVPPRDDRPFFFFVLKPDRWLFKSTEGKLGPGAGLPQNVGAAMLMRNIFITASCFALLIILIPFLAGPRRRKAERRSVPLRWIVYFAGIGAGYMFMEIPLIQKFILPLGHPVMATAMVLGPLLLASGLGSYFWGKMDLDAIAGRAPKVVAAAAGFGLAYYLFMDGAAQLLLSFPAWARASAAVLLIAPAGFFMGGAFPMAVRLVGERSTSAIAWLWAINGAFSVQASVLAMMLSMIFGFRICFIAAAAAYLLAFIVACKARRGAAPHATPLR